MYSYGTRQKHASSSFIRTVEYTTWHLSPGDAPRLPDMILIKTVSVCAFDGGYSIKKRGSSTVAVPYRFTAPNKSQQLKNIRESVVSRADINFCLIPQSSCAFPSRRCGQFPTQLQLVSISDTRFRTRKTPLLCSKHKQGRSVIEGSVACFHPTRAVSKPA